MVLEVVVPDSNRVSVYVRLLLVSAVIILLSTTFHVKADASFQPAVSVGLPDGGVAGLEFSCQPALGACGTPNSSGDKTSWQCSDYSLDVEVSRVQGGYGLAFQLNRAGGAPFVLYDYGAHVSVPYAHGDAVWSYNRLATRDIMETSLGNPVTYQTAPNLGVPFVALVDGSGISQLSMGLMSQDHVVSIEGDLSGDSAEYGFSIKRVDTQQTNQLGDAFFISRTQDTWFNQAKAYASAVDARRGYVPLNIPPAASNPTYDSWYWTADNVNQSLVWRLAQISCSLGFKSYLFDSGWDTHAGQYAKWLDGSTGDYSPPVESFRNFPALLDKIRNQLGMRVMLWMQQYALGRESVYYPQLASALSYWADPVTGALQETPALCPRVLGTGQHMVDLFDRIMNDYQPDGLWFDWQEYIPLVCSAPHQHDYSSFGEGYNSTQQAVLNTVVQHNPDVFMEMRWPFANLNNKPYIQMWQPVDSPGDFEAMRLRALNMRAFSSGILTGTDEMYWDPALSDTDASRFMSTVVFTGVPYFGPNLLAASSSQKEMLSAWLRFYEAHQKDLIEGEFEPYGNPNHPDQIIEGSRETFIYYGNGYNSVRLTKPNERIYIVNASQSQGIDLNLTGIKPGHYIAVVSDLQLADRRTSQFSAPTDNARLAIDLPVGCLLTLTRRKPQLSVVQRKLLH
jgi:hypothetical protein